MANDLKGTYFVHTHRGVIEPLTGSTSTSRRCDAVRGDELGILVDPSGGEEIKAGIICTLDQPRGVVP